MNLNLNLKVDKAMNMLSASKPLRTWTYIIASIVLIGILLWQLAPILQSVAILAATLK